ncbi:hypothetical protein [Nitrospirillum sp. BR 11163]|uniref:hypothetical protein n=1 Tax=Nitrospirillum sp. BR 11163 TaxID=3104323 RepID=UPI002AFEB5B7|nr:hypothetical protein [Nitrospirillum sp. BR 11163]MEA1672554.1 hypothetical protein [Nitrospirillum sp. BR 11163]
MEDITYYDAEEIRRKLERAADELDAAGDPILARRLREIVDLDRAGDGVPAVRLRDNGRARGWTPMVVIGGAAPRK